MMPFNKLKHTAPKTVMISPTDSCNLKCSFCWRLEKEEDPNTWRAKELSFDEIRKVVLDCAEMGVETIDLTGGGEAFMRQDIMDIIRLVKENGMRCSLTTNSTLLNEQKIKRLVELGLDDICFSLESGDEEVSDRIRGAGTYKKTIAAMSTLKKIKQEQKKTLPAARIGTVITAWNYNHLKSLERFVKDNGIESINFSVMLEWKSNKGMSVAGKSAQVMYELRTLDQLLDNEKITHNLKPILKHGLGSHATPEACYAPWQMLFINSQGSVLGCCILASFYENVIGNVREQSLPEIWNGSKMNKFRKKIMNKEWFAGCERCLPQFVEDFNRMHKDKGEAR